PATGRAIARSHVSKNRALLGSIDVETPSFVTLSSQNGRFPVTITNGSAETVVVGLDVEATGGRLDVDEVDPVTIEPDQRRSISLVTHARAIGIADVDVRLRTQAGRPFGQGADFQVRTTQIGSVIWVVMAVAVAVLLLAATRRITQRVRAHRRGSAG
ncbi:MAG: DUF6049 family protein, partial [Actinomycetota bacterium]|nr:DUF6049 family protein [Actinomycetota bacterium]